MKKDFLPQFIFLIAFLLLSSLFKTFVLSGNNWFGLPYIEFWVGGIVGTLLVYSDHLIYIYFLRPNEVNSVEATRLISERKAGKAMDLMLSSKIDKENLIYHSANVQLLFVIVAFWVITSGQSLLGRGILLAFLLHLLVDMTQDLVETKTISNWFVKFPIQLDVLQQKWYLVAQIVILFAMGFIL